MLKLIIGNKKYSSWSMRPWLVLKHTGAPFEEEVIGLDLPETAAAIAKVNAAGRVPVLFDDGLKVWDSLAICEYLAEKFPAAQLWPAGVEARAQARSACAEMHSGFQAMRSDLSMRLTLKPTPVLRPEVAADIARITALWVELRGRHGQSGPFLFGRFGIADAFFAPVAVGRFLPYGVALTGVAKEYVDALAAHPAVRAWVDGAQQETLRAKRYE
jgi:glutathione S-transferase